MVQWHPFRLTTYLGPPVEFVERHFAGRLKQAGRVGHVAHPLLGGIWGRRLGRAGGRAVDVIGGHHRHGYLAAAQLILDLNILSRIC